jgi:hypothetical protein
MGQEASLPADGEDDLEELAPPSHTTAATPSSSSMHHPGQHQQHGGGGGKTTASKVPQKMLNMMRAFEQTARGDDSLQKMDSTEGGAGIIPTTGGTATTTTTTKASLFRPTATARGVISQMRSLRINKQSVEKPPKAEQVQDWEKQWYADDEDDSDEEEDVVAASPGGYHNAASSSVPPVGGGSSSAGVVVTPTNAAMARPGLDSGPAIMSSSHVHLVTPPDLLASGRAAPSSQMLAYSEVSLNHHQQQQHVHMQPDEVFTGVLDPSGKKPDVAMFLPMLRVLGKGSFGKVRTKHESLYFLVN